MNAEAQSRGLPAILKSLNCDRGYGLGLLAACALLALLELGGDPLRLALRYDRDALALGEWWRAITAHFVHLDAEHTLLNTLGVVLMWALFARDYTLPRWAAIYLSSALAISAGLWIFDPGVPWYVGASGALHGVMAAGTLAHLRRRDLDSWILAVILLAKLTYEQVAGSMPFAGDASTVVDAHLYGAIGGLSLALFLRSRREPQ
ncbi:MAG TPA: rhombosortase [Steroidobacteraceae bacterium]|jgi:rhomboid family GlyGly-CTERM serine protease|nr:rhombosortase [Steroidobacteraceae bacterium]